MTGFDNYQRLLAAATETQSSAALLLDQAAGFAAGIQGMVTMLEQERKINRERVGAVIAAMNDFHAGVTSAFGNWAEARDRQITEQINHCAGVLTGMGAVEAGAPADNPATAEAEAA